MIGFRLTSVWLDNKMVQVFLSQSVGIVNSKKRELLSTLRWNC